MLSEYPLLPDLPKPFAIQPEVGIFAKIDDQTRTTPAIEFRHVSLAYDEHVVLDDISFELRRGELLIVLSGSGGGKSTILKLALGLFKPMSSVRFLTSIYAYVDSGGEVVFKEEDDHLGLINTRVMMLHEGRVTFCGSGEEFVKSADPYIRDFLLV